MPVKWTPDVDQLLLIKILETHDVNVDAKKIAAAWPTDKGEAPTPRAITERLVKIRAMAKANGAGGFGISSSQSKGSTPSSKSNAGASRKPSAITTPTPSKSSVPKPSPAKRTFDEAHIKGEPIDSDDEKPAKLQTPLRNGNTPHRHSTATVSDFNRAVSQSTQREGQVIPGRQERAEETISNLDGAADYGPLTPMAQLSVDRVGSNSPTATDESPTKKAKRDAEMKREHMANGTSNGVVSSMAHFAYDEEDDDDDDDDDAYAV